VVFYISMIFPVYKTELHLPEVGDLDDLSQAFERGLHRNRRTILGSIAVGEALPLGEDVYHLGETPKNPNIDRTYLLTRDLSIRRARVNVRNDVKEYEEEPIDLKGRGIFNDMEVSIAGLYYQSNKYIGWMNIQPRIGLFTTLNEDQKRKMLEL